MEAITRQPLNSYAVLQVVGNTEGFRGEVVPILAQVHPSEIDEGLA